MAIAWKTGKLYGAKSKGGESTVTGAAQMYEISSGENESGSGRQSVARRGSFAAMHASEMLIQLIQRFSTHRRLDRAQSSTTLISVIIRNALTAKRRPMSPLSGPRPQPPSHCSCREAADTMV